MIEGQTSTLQLDELRQLQQEADREKSKERNDGTAAGFLSGLDAFIEALPDEHEQADLPGDVAEPSAPRREILPILVSNGWPERYTIDLDEPQGGAWLAGFALAQPVIASGGLLILHGKRGTGKTRMAAEIARTGRFPLDQTKGQKIADSIPDNRRTAVYRTAMDFFLDVRDTYKPSGKKIEGRSEKFVIDALKRPGLLIIDELQERGDTPFEDRLLTHLIDARYGAMRSTILIANLSAAELGPALGPSIVDRAHENGRRVEFTWDSYRRAKR